jgi:hypothetical protein
MWHDDPQGHVDTKPIGSSGFRAFGQVVSKETRMKRLIVATMLVLLCLLSAPAFAQSDDAKKDGKKVGETATQAGKEVGQAGKEVGKKAGETGKDVGKAGKKVGKASGDAAKDVGKKSGSVAKTVGKKTKSGAKTVKRKVTGGTLRATCNDGTTYTGKTRDGACADHRGVKSWVK